MSLVIKVMLTQTISKTHQDNAIFL